jgi:6-phosphogluconate dehydrogenase (decarboxylating)
LQGYAQEAGYNDCGIVYLFVRRAGAGHFVKMIHNGIEYEMLEAYGEGFAILDNSQFRDSFDFAKIAHLWNQGSVVCSWLLELAEDAFNKDLSFTRVRGYVDDSAWIEKQRCLKSDFVFGDPLGVG